VIICWYIDVDRGPISFLTFPSGSPPPPLHPKNSFFQTKGCMFPCSLFPSTSISPIIDFCTEKASEIHKPQSSFAALNSPAVPYQISHRLYLLFSKWGGRGALLNDGLPPPTRRPSPLLERKRFHLEKKSSPVFLPSAEDISGFGPSSRISAVFVNMTIRHPRAQ